MLQIQKYSDVQNLVSEKVNVFTDSMVEDVQDIVKVEFPEVQGFARGVLPPEYVETRAKLKEIISDYIHQNIIYSTDDERLMEEAFLIF